MEQKTLSTPANESEIADFLLENPKLSIGEYIRDRKNANIRTGGICQVICVC